MLKFGSGDSGDADGDSSFRPGKWFTGLFNKDEDEDLLLKGEGSSGEGNAEKPATESDGGQEESSWLSGFKGIFKKDENTSETPKEAHEELYDMDNESEGSWFSNLTDRFSIKSKDNKAPEASPVQSQAGTPGQSDRDVTKESDATDAKSSSPQSGQSNNAVSWLLNVKGGDNSGKNDQQKTTSTSAAAKSAGLDLSLYSTETDDNADEDSETASKKTDGGWFSNIKGLVGRKEPDEAPVEKATDPQTGINKYIYSLKLQVRAISTYFKRIVSLTSK